jgi:hypothetical protein
MSFISCCWPFALLIHPTSQLSKLEKQLQAIEAERQSDLEVREHALLTFAIPK